MACQNRIPSSVQSQFSELPKTIDYNLQVKPILSDRCFACHGNDQNKLKAGLRLDLVESATAPLPDHPDKTAIVPGRIHQSELVERILSDDPELVMPPPESQLSLTDREMAILITWIKQGAEFKPHWSFQKPQSHPAPKVSDDAWPTNTIDQFIMKKLEDKGLRPNPMADKETFLRRVSLDLTGLPPTIAEMDSFLQDEDPSAYERVVNRLLSSPHYGERMAIDWMDVSRFADTHGYTVDRFRDMSPWRDWVIQAFNENMPYDTFVIWQLAGDLLPDPTDEQILATGFNRNHQQNMEGGIVDEEFRVEYVADRTNTFGTAFLGVTLECAKCHDHKYDPISQKEYFQLFSFFNNVKEAGQISWDNATPAPSMFLTNESSDSTMAFLEAQIQRKEQALQRITLDQPAIQDFRVNLDQGLIAHFELDNSLINRQSGQKALMGQQNVKHVVPQFAPGLDGSSLLLDGDAWLDLQPMGQFSRLQPFTIGFWIHLPATIQNGVLLHQGIGAALYNYRGFHLAIKDNQLEVLMAHNAPYNAIIQYGPDLPREEWIHLALRYDGSTKASGLQVFLNGTQMNLRIDQDNLYKSILFEGSQPGIQFGARWRGAGVRGAKLDEISIYNRRLSAFEINQLVAQLQPLRVGKPSQSALNDHALLRSSGYIRIFSEISALRDQLATIQDTLREIMVMSEMDSPRQTHVLQRGQYNVLGAAVHPGTPESILNFPEEYPVNRLGLAQWLFHQSNPLTARVIVNRIWQQFFEHGLVTTSNDFGFQGSLPTHPELLDHLAIFLQENDWNLKKLIKQIVLSSTYRQSSRPNNQSIDPENIWLSRGPAKRLSAEMMRDQVLSASNILNTKIGGPSVMPYQPEGLWRVNGGQYIQAEGSDLYRRSLYTFWKRTVPNPTLNTFDVPDKSTCTVSRQKTSTPLQALVLLNDPTYIEASKILGEYISKESNHSKGISKAFRKLTGRYPTNQEIQTLIELYKRQKLVFEEDIKKAKGWLETGQYQINASADKATIAANAVVASTIMNSEAAITKK